MDKYTQNLSVDGTKGIPYYRTRIVSSAPREDIPYFYTARMGDRLDRLANVFYKDSSKWWILAKANSLVDATIAIQPGMTIYIPRI